MPLGSSNYCTPALIYAFFVFRLPNVRYVTGFSGSNGQALVTPDGGVFFTDGRYAEQSRHEVPDLRREIHGGLQVVAHLGHVGPLEEVRSVVGGVARSHAGILRHRP